jgi:phenylpyruvate tautomerase PptA (4-oxalocrotonate tautomerase family)
LKSSPDEGPNLAERGYDERMPYLRLSSLPLDDATKRHLADELTSTVLEVLTDQKPEWTTVHFTPFQPDDFAVAGRLVSDGALADTHLEISAPGVDEKSWFALRNRLNDVLVDALAIPDSERWHVNVKLNRYDPHSFAVAGNASDELDDLGSGEADITWEKRRGGWRRRALFIGFVVGAYASYRWFAGRVATDAVVDAAPPVDEPHGEAVDAGDPDGRTTTEAAPAREY